LRSKSQSRVMAAPFLLGAMCLLVLAGCGGSNNNTATGTTSKAVNNTAALTAGFGQEGPAGGFVNGVFVNITVCQHGTTSCTPVNNVLVDTGSIGLRVLSSALGSVTLGQILQSNSALLECIQYGDTSYSWGPMALADVQITGEQASNIPVQLIGGTTLAAPSSCLTNPVNPNLPNGGNEDTPQSLGANGILGIAGNNGTGDGEGIFDCGSFCTTNASGSPYYICPGGNCQEIAVATSFQAANPVAAFSSPDKNGVMITFPAVGATGTTMLLGTMNFGIGTETDNALGAVTVYAMDPCGSLPSVNFNGVSYTDSSCTSAGGNGLGGFLDTGSNALYILDANTLSSFGISDCSSSTNAPGFYCVSGGNVTLSNIGILGNGVGSGTISLNIASATTLFNMNNAVFNNLGSDSVVGGSASTDFFDFGSPFFFGRTVFIGIGGVSGVDSGTAPTGFVAF
jgi:hypothetical protein